jgi:hypothetical protein
MTTEQDLDEAKRANKRQQDLVEAQHDRVNSDNWWWLIARTPNREIHVYELGKAQTFDITDERDEKIGESSTALTDERRAVIAAEMGMPDDAGGPGSGWDLSMAPGRPNTYVEPKAYDADGNLLPIKAKAGVTLHLLPEVEPGTAADAE